MNEKVSKKSYHHGNLRQALIKVGLEELKTQPIHNISYRQLARKLGVSQMAPYRHFDDKDEFLSAIAAESFALLSNFFQKATKASSKSDPTLQLGEAYIRFATKYPYIFRFMFSCPKSLKEKNKNFDQNAKKAFGYIKNAIAAKYPHLSSTQVEERALYDWALVHGLSSLYLDGQTDLSIESIVNALSLSN